MPLQTVVVTLDGSRFSETALPVATSIARAARATLRLLMVHEPYLALVPAVTGYNVAEVAEAEENAVRERQKTYLAGASASLGKVGADAPQYQLLEGMAGPALVDEFQRTVPDLVVMATHGRGPLSRLWLGSVADHVVRHSDRPILLLHPSDGQIPPVERQFRTGLVLLDGSADAEAILPMVASFSQCLQSHLTLFHVAEPNLRLLGVTLQTYSSPEIDEAARTAREEGQAYLDRVADRLREAGVRVAAQSVIGAGVVPTVLSRLEEGQFDFVALTTHGVGGFRRAVLGSVADKIIRASQKPVLVVRPLMTEPEAKKAPAA